MSRTAAGIKLSEIPKLVFDLSFNYLYHFFYSFVNWRFAIRTETSPFGVFNSTCAFESSWFLFLLKWFGSILFSSSVSHPLSLEGGKAVFHSTEKSEQTEISVKIFLSGKYQEQSRKSWRKNKLKHFQHCWRIF